MCVHIRLRRMRPAQRFAAKILVMLLRTILIKVCKIKPLQHFLSPENFYCKGNCVIVTSVPSRMIRHGFRKAIRKNKSRREKMLLEYNIP